MEYTYDLFDRRIARKIDADGNGVFETTQRFVYDGEDLILAFSGATNVLTNRYLYGPGTDEILADEKITTGTASTAGTVTWSLGDNLGTIRDLVQYNAATGTTTVVNHVRYDTFGQIVSQTNSQFQPWFAYTGREWDPAAGLYFYRARWYDPRAGRFLSEDPLGFAAGDVNLSRYVGNGATLWVDPSGKTLSYPVDRNGDVVTPKPVMGHGASQVLGGLLEAGAGALVLSGSVLAEAPTLGAATVGVIGGSLLVSDGLDRVIGGFQELTTGRVRDTALDEIAKYFGGDSAAYALNELREQFELYALTVGIGMVASPSGVSPSRSPDPAARRPKLRKATKEQAQTDALKTADGDYIDPNTGQVIPKQGPFDYGHPKGQEWWRLRDQARAENWTRQQVIEAENAKKFQIEDPSSNRGHIHEQHDSTQ